MFAEAEHIPEDKRWYYFSELKIKVEGEGFYPSNHFNFPFDDEDGRERFNFSNNT